MFPAALGKKLLRMAADPDIQVRYQLAFTLGETSDPEKVKTLAQLIRRAAADGWMRTAVLNSSDTAAGKVFELSIADLPFRASAAGQEFLGQLVKVIGAKNDPGEG